MRFNFLTYANRSGSTVFARRLTACTPDLLVVPEFRLPGILLAYGDAHVAKMSASKLHDILVLDGQLTESLGFDQAAMRALAYDNAGLGIRPLLESIARAYGEKIGSASTDVVLKGSLAAHYPRSIRAVFPEARILHIVRDGRAVANSMLRTPVLWHKSERMGRKDIYFCARHWHDSLAAASKLAAELPYLELRFEHLLADESKLLQEVCEFLDVEYQQGAREAASFEVSEREQRIHPLLDKELIPDREKAWQHELKQWQGLALETQVGRSLRRYGYEPHFSKDTSRADRSKAMARAVAVHLVVTPRWAIKRLWALRHRRRYILVAARTALHRFSIR